MALSFINSKSTVRACGLVGVPNVGKSTLFNALTSSQKAAAANFAFCTIEPNVARVPVPDDRLDALAQMANSERITRAQLEFVDIAGLVAGASKGAGMGNKFLSNIRGVSVIIHLVRCFGDDATDETGNKIFNVSGSVDPVRDLKIINQELILADLDVLLPMLEKKSKKEKEKENAEMRIDVITRAIDALSEGKSAHTIMITEEEWPIFNSLQLLTAKPMLYACNVKEDEAATGNQMVETVKGYLQKQSIVGESDPVLVVSAKLESEVALMDEGENRDMFLGMYGLKETGLPKIIKASRTLLGQQTFFTVGPTEARAWSIRKGATAIDAAGSIHSDFAKGFIKAEVIAYDDYISYGGEKACKSAGKLRFEGPDYVMKDGDVCLFRFK